MLKKIIITILILAVIGGLCALVHNLKVARRNKRELALFSQE